MDKISTKRRMLIKCRKLKRHMSNTLKASSVFLAVTLVAVLSFPTLVLAADLTVEAPSTGEVEVSAPGTVSNAEILNLTSTDGLATTAAVVAEGTLSFYAEQSGTYNVTRSGNDVWTLINELDTTSAFSHISQRSVLSPQIASTSTGGISKSSLSSSYTGYENTTTYAYGTQTMPIRALNHFVSTTDEPSGSVELSLVAANALLGSYYDSSGNLVEFEPSYLVVEDRDENTGRLLASVTFSPDTEGSAASTTGGTDAFNLVVNPSEELLRDRLASHSSYASDATALSTLVTALTSFESSSSNAVVLAGLDSMAAYSTGAKEFTLDIATLSGGKISAGDTVSLKYVAAGADRNAHTLDSEQEALLADTYVKNLKVDSDGYITFTLLGGGIYLLGNDSTVQSFTLYPSSSTSGSGSSGSASSSSSSSSTSSSASGGTTLLGSSSSASADSASSSSSTASADAIPTSSSESADAESAEDSDTTVVADSDLFSTLADEEAAAATEDGEAEGSSSTSSLSNVFTDESGNLNIASIVVALALVAACALAGIILYRRAKNRKEQEQQKLAEAEAEQAAEEERKALEQMSPEERGQIATAAATTAAASAAEDGMDLFMKRASSEKIEETTEQKVKRKVQTNTDSSSQSFVEEGSSVQDLLNSTRTQGAAGQA